MWKVKIREWMTNAGPLVQKYRYALIILLAGVFILYVGAPRDEPAAETKAQTAAQTSDFDLDSFEQDLQQKLTLIEGAGPVELMLTMEDTEEIVYASDTRQSASGEDSASFESSLSVLSDGNYGERPVRIKSVCPTFRGAVVLCGGADDTAVRWAITQAVAAACGLRTDKITVLKMQSDLEGKGVAK